VPFHARGFGANRQARVFLYDADDARHAAAFHTYYPFGGEATDPSQDEVRLKFTGHERDDNGSAGPGMLDYMHARYCSPTLGRFFSTDSNPGSPTKPQSWNRYLYSRGNPINLLDPNGRTVESALQLIRDNSKNIFQASANTKGHVTPLEIARIIFQENRNDMNLIKDNNASSFLGFGGPELKNLVGEGLTALLGSNISFGIGEMKVETAAPLLGLDPEKITQQNRGLIVGTLQKPKSAIMLVAMELKRLKDARGEVLTGALLASAYNTGNSNMQELTEVGIRSELHIKEIIAALFDFYFSTLPEPGSDE